MIAGLAAALGVVLIVVIAVVVVRHRRQQHIKQAQTRSVIAFSNPTVCLSFLVSLSLSVCVSFVFSLCLIFLVFFWSLLIPPCFLFLLVSLTRDSHTFLFWAPLLLLCISSYVSTTGKRTPRRILSMTMTPDSTSLMTKVSGHVFINTSSDPLCTVGYSFPANGTTWSWSFKCDSHFCLYHIEGTGPICMLLWFHFSFVCFPSSRWFVFCVFF